MLPSIHWEGKLPQISVSPTQGKYLQVLAKLCKANGFSKSGHSAVTVYLDGTALPPTGKLISLEIDPNHAAVARKNIIHAGLDTM